MRDNPALEKGKRPHPLRPINHLARHHKVLRPNLLLQTADGAEGDDHAHADGAESGDVGAVGDLVGCEGVVRAVAGQEGDWCWLFWRWGG